MTRDVNEAHRLAPDNPRYLLAVAILERELAQRQKRLARPASTALLAARATDAPEFVFLAEDALGRRRIAAAEHYAGRRSLPIPRVRFATCPPRT